MSEIQGLFKQFKDKVACNISIDNKIPDIISFCYDKRYLNFSRKKMRLFPMQQIILKTFYRGQRGNETLKLTEEELQILENEKMTAVIEKYHSNELFRELVLVLGRRSGKDFMVGVMAAYEAMRLMEIPGGDPYRYFDIGDGNPIYILTIANSSDQATVLFNEIKTHMVLSEYFRDKIGAIESDKIWLRTPADKRNNKELIEQGFSPTKGSICVMSGHSNSDSLLGKGYYVLLFDEVASYKKTGSAQSGDRLYEALGPGQVAFKRPVLDANGQLQYDENGDVLTTLESKIISISSPRGEEGILFKLYQESSKVDDRLAFRLPTWKVNSSISYQMLKKQNQYMNVNAFNMEFGAEFSGVGGEKFIPDEYVNTAVDIGRQIGLDQREVGIPGVVYYAHLDPAASSHNYALVVLHTEDRIRWVEQDDGSKRKEKVKFFVVDHMKQWQPIGNRQINVNEVDDYIIALAKRFRFAMVSYDAWNSLASIQKLRSKGIPSKTTAFRKQYKMFIYNHLEHIMVNKCLALPHKGPYAQDMEMELKCLKRIYNHGTGFSIKPDLEAVKTTDDLVDALAGAAGVAIEAAYNGYSMGATVFMPQSQFANQQWKIGAAANNMRNQLRISNRKFGI